MAYLHLSHSERWLNDTGSSAPKSHVWDGLPLRCLWCGHLKQGGKCYPPEPPRKEPNPT